MRKSERRERERERARGISVRQRPTSIHAQADIDMSGSDFPEQVAGIKRTSKQSIEHLGPGRDHDLIGALSMEVGRRAETHGNNLGS